MDRRLPMIFGKWAVLLIATFALSAVLIAPAHAQTRHHISFGLGYAKLLSNDMKDEFTGIDFTNAAHAGLAYRYSLTPEIDLSFDSQATASQDEFAGVKLTLTNSFVGPGVRLYATMASPRPFVQANVFFVREKAEAEHNGVKVTGSETGAGFGITGGIDIQMSPLLSLPLTVHYLNAKPADDVSGLGFNVALAFNFGGKL